MPLFNCTLENPEYGKMVEALNHFRYEHNRAMLCVGSKLDQIGYMFHWGVNSKDKYIKAWVHYRIQRQSLHSRENINHAFRLFQGRMWRKTFNGTNDLGIFIFNSLLWDINRFPDAGQSEREFYAEWRADYVSQVVDLLRMARPGKDELVLQKMHYLERGHPFRPHAMALNRIIEQTASLLELPVLDLTAFVEDDGRHLRRGDFRHQTPQNSLLVAEQIGLRNWTYFRGCNVTF